MPKLKVLQGGNDGRPNTADLPHVCPWCGARFKVRWATPRKTKAEAAKDPPSLEGHWWASPECSANRDTNNPTQSKYKGPEDE